MNEMDDPFVYEKPIWLVLHEREQRRKSRAKRLGREIGTWGGKREGAGIKKKKEYTHVARLNITNVQYQILSDMGNGDFEKGLAKLINDEI